MRSIFTQAKSIFTKLTIEDFRIAAKNGNVAVVQLYINQFPDADARRDAISSGRDPQAGVYIQGRDVELDRNSALVLAVAYGRLEVVNLLLQNGADVNKKSDSGQYPLTASCQYGNVPIDTRIAIITALLAKGAIKESKNQEGKTVLDLAKEGLSEASEERIDNLLNPPEYRPQTPEEHKEEEAFREKVAVIDKAELEFKRAMCCPITLQVMFDPVTPIYAVAANESKGDKANREKAEEKVNHYERIDIVNALKTKQTDPMNPDFVIVGLKRDADLKKAIAAELETLYQAAVAKKQTVTTDTEEKKGEAVSHVTVHVPESPHPVTSTTQALFSGSQNGSTLTETPAPTPSENENTARSRSRSPSGGRRDSE